MNDTEKKDKILIMLMMHIVGIISINTQSSLCKTANNFGEKFRQNVILCTFHHKFM